MDSGYRISSKQLILEIFDTLNFDCSSFTQLNYNPCPQGSYFHLRLEVVEDRNTTRTFDGYLPRNHNLFYYLRDFNELYSQLTSTLICTINQNSLENIPSQDLIRLRLRTLQPQLIRELNNWLNQSEHFAHIRYEIYSQKTIGLEFNDLLIVKTSNIWLQKIPWHRWDFLSSNNDQNRTEVIIYPPSISYSNQGQRVHINSANRNRRDRVKVLIVIGKYHDITFENGNITSEQIIGYSEINQCLSNPYMQPSIIDNCDIHYLTQEELNPNSNNITAFTEASEACNFIRNKKWDILLLFGHMETDNDSHSYFQLNNNVLSFDSLKECINTASNRGNKSKLLICLGCSSIGFANNLNHSTQRFKNLKHCVAIKSKIRYQEAFLLLSNLLQGFIDTGYLHRGMQEARVRLFESEVEGIPCVSLLPSIYCFQPYSSPALRWEDLIPDTITTPPPSPRNQNIVLSSLIGWNFGIMFLFCLKNFSSIWLILTILIAMIFSIILLGYSEAEYQKFIPIRYLLLSIFSIATIVITASLSLLKLTIIFSLFWSVIFILASWISEIITLNYYEP